MSRVHSMDMTNDPNTMISDDHPIVVLVEWQATAMSISQAEEMAHSALAVLRAVPGLNEARIFGDFESGTHYFLLTWRDRASMERYMASDAMHAVRSAALPFVAGKPGRRFFVDYGATGAERPSAEA